jgi:diaminopimelate epimerase
MQIRFYKYQGTGNDFVIIDNRDGRHDALTTAQVARLCNRRFGIGGDGLMLLNTRTSYDFEMKYHNSDGREASMCGNGGRCLVKFAYDLGMVKTTYRFLAIDGEHEAEVDIDGTVALKMNDVSEVKQQRHGQFVLNTGSPHFIEFSQDVMSLDVFNKGRRIRNSPEFVKEGINVNFVEQTGEDRIIVRTYERGVEDETYSCGTGVTAAALVCFHNDNGFNRVEVKTKGGNLSVEYDKIGNTYKDIWLNGPAERVFEGMIEIR